MVALISSSLVEFGKRQMRNDKSSLLVSESLREVREHKGTEVASMLG